MLPILLSIGPITIYSLSVFLVLAWGIWSFLFWKSLRTEGIAEDPMFDLMFYGSLAAIVFSRCGFVLFHWDLFSDTWLKIIALWVQPGLSLYAGVLGGCLLLIIFAKYNKIRLGIIVDALGLSLPSAILIGKIGSLLDGSEVGKIAEKLPWAIRYVGHLNVRHPVQFYEILYLGLIVVVLSLLQVRSIKKKWSYGIFGLYFFLLYPPGMFILEFFKEHAIYWTLSANQWILIALWAEALGMYYVRSDMRDTIQPFFARRRHAITLFIGDIYAAIKRKRNS